VHRIALLVRHLKVFTREQGKPARPYQINKLIESAMSAVGNEVEQKARIVRDLAADLPNLLGDPNHIEQVLVNLLLNAMQSIPDGDPAGHSIRLSSRYAPDGNIVIEVSDTGCGIAPANMDRVFEAFFSTKPVGDGTGLGLAISHSIIQAHGGTISIESTPGSGTTVTVMIPLAGTQAAAAARDWLPKQRSHTG
jgi:signal transduction histidine kinase